MPQGWLTGGIDMPLRQQRHFLSACFLKAIGDSPTSINPSSVEAQVLGNFLRRSKTCF
jgi:hypothetical protein